jgi:uncharacterized membrane protein
MASRVSMFISASLAVVAFIVYFGVAPQFLDYTPYYIRVLGLALDIGLLCSAVAIVSAVIAARRQDTSKAQVRVCVAVGIFLLVVSLFALYATRAI